MTKSSHARLSSPLQASNEASAGLSRYGQLSGALRGRILSGEWAPGDALPAEATMAKTSGVALGTMRQAIAVLVEEGLLTREQGRGTFVRRGLEGASMLRFFRFRRDASVTEVPTSAILAKRVRRATQVECDTFALAPSGRVLTIKRVRSLHGQACLLESITLPMPLFTPLATLDASTWGPLLYPLYQQCCQVVVARARDDLRVVPLSSADAQSLGLSHPAPGLRVIRNAYDRAGLCVEMRTTLGDAYSFDYAAEVR